MAEQNISPYEPVVDEYSEERLVSIEKPIRTWRDDQRLKLILAILTFSALAITLLLVAPVISFVLDRLGLRPPVVSGIFDWLGSGFNGFLVMLVLVAVVVVAVIAMRHRILQNPFYYVPAGCPQCLEHELIRVRRHRSDRVLGYIGIPAERRVCRNCSWDGLRVSGAYHGVGAVEVNELPESWSGLEENLENETIEPLAR